MSSDDPSSREFAAVAFALAIARGQLASVLTGKFEHEEVARVLAGTSAANLAKVIGTKEERLAKDWNDDLSTAEKRAIQGAIRD